MTDKKKDMKNCYVTICAMNMKWGVMIMNDKKRIVAGHVKDRRLAVYDMKEICFAMLLQKMKHSSYRSCMLLVVVDRIVGYEPQTLISFIVKHGITLQSYDFIDISSYTDFRLQ